MSDYSPPPPSEEEVAEKLKIKTVKKQKKLAAMREMGFSQKQAKGLLQMGISPKVKVKTIPIETIPGNKYSKITALHPDEEIWLPSSMINK